MIQASCEGMIDYSEANLLDPRWWQKLWLTLDYLERQNVIKLEEYGLQLNLAVLDYGTTDSTFDTHWRQAEQSRNRLSGAVAPWIASGAKSAAEATAALRAQWIAEWGDPASADTQAKVQEIIDYWKSLRERRQARHGAGL